MEIIVLSITEYKEKDGIVNALSAEGPISFLVKSIFDNKSKNAYLNCLLTRADVNFREGNFKYHILSNSTPLNCPMSKNGDFYYMTSLMLIVELIKNLMDENEHKIIYEHLKQSIDYLIETGDYLKVLLFIISQIFKITGYQFEVNKCTICGSKKSISAFSFIEGGLICTNCLNKDQIYEFEIPQIMLLRSAFNASKCQDISETEKSDYMFVINKLIKFISEVTNTKINSFELLKL